MQSQGEDVRKDRRQNGRSDQLRTSLCVDPLGPMVDDGEVVDVVVVSGDVSTSPPPISLP